MSNKVSLVLGDGVLARLDALCDRAGVTRSPCVALILDHVLPPLSEADAAGAGGGKEQAARAASAEPGGLEPAGVPEPGDDWPFDLDFESEDH